MAGDSDGFFLATTRFLLSGIAPGSSRRGVGAPALKAGAHAAAEFAGTCMAALAEILQPDEMHLLRDAAAGYECFGCRDDSLVQWDRYTHLSVKWDEKWGLVMWASVRRCSIGKVQANVRKHALNGATGVEQQAERHGTTHVLM
ncbi:hypothetical protein GUJ93_ZPchr0010g8719 [Zizania palustris]|uniref:Uncharacterized protein n=1 Tax=Zizania palustris TaxID=103762 RepID=A0A8J5W7D9_ZIZPA|nr:hypothetical protein GUJ93_ZPchr0010g8719 [Zizania palustris]